MQWTLRQLTNLKMFASDKFAQEKLAKATGWNDMT